MAGSARVSWGVDPAGPARGVVVVVVTGGGEVTGSDDVVVVATSSRKRSSASATPISVTRPPVLSR